MRYVILILPAICFLFMLKSAIENHLARKRKARGVGIVRFPVGSIVPKDSLQYETAMRAMKSGKPCIGTVTPTGEAVFTELEWPKGHQSGG